MSSRNIVKKVIRHPMSNKIMRDVFVNGKGWFRWNTVYKVYNSTANYEQLTNVDAQKIDYSKTN